MSTSFGSNREFYEYLDTVIEDLREAGFSREAATLEHRLHRVAWTTANELFQELEQLLGGLSKLDLPSALLAKVQRCVTTLEEI